MRAPTRRPLRRLQLTAAALAAVSLGMALAAVADDGGTVDFGGLVERELAVRSPSLFGFEQPLAHSAPATAGARRAPAQGAETQVLLAPGLKAEYLTRSAADWTDMMVPYPPAQPTHLITCVEGPRRTIGDGRYNPSMQRIELATGAVTTVLRGLDHCDGIRATAWGTVLATEEAADGGAYEILAPLHTTEQTVLDRARGTVTDPTHVAKRPALPTIAWEGLAVLASGVVIAGDELRPGERGADTDGGAIFKFIPTHRRVASGAIAQLADSPLTSGQVYALQVLAGRDRHGQGAEVGTARWIAVRAADARADAHARGATGYYRPEDLHADPLFKDPRRKAAVRFCWSNTGRADYHHYGEVMCAVDDEPEDAGSRVTVNRFIEGDADFNSFDNLEFQPRTGNLYVVEDRPNGDVFACLPDGTDRDIKSDGCVRVLSLTDPSAEPTGLVFDPTGATAYVSVQHSDDSLMPMVDGYPTDDILKITGFRRAR